MIELPDGVLDRARRGDVDAFRAILEAFQAPVHQTVFRLVGGRFPQEIEDITQDVFLETETNAYADILLPGALWAESEYVALNSERNLTLLQQAVDPVGEAMTDWEIIARVACEMGYAEAFTYSSAEEIFEELKSFWNPRTGYDLRGVTYEQLRNTPVQWPCPPNAALAEGGIVGR